MMEAHLVSNRRLGPVKAIHHVVACVNDGAVGLRGRYDSCNLAAWKRQHSNPVAWGSEARVSADVRLKRVDDCCQRPRLQRMRR